MKNTEFVLFLLVTMLSLFNVRSFRAVTVSTAVTTNRLLTHSRRALTMEAEKATIKRMSVSQFGDILKSDSRPSYQIVDVREPNELAVASITGADIINLPLGDAASWSPKVEAGDLLDKTKPTICLCKVGMRSMRVATFLIGQGFEEVYNVDGGINQYADKIDPTIPQY